MSNNYVIITDSNSELPLELAKKYNVDFVRMPYILEDVEYYYDLGENTDFKEFFQKARNGILSTTATYPPQHYVDKWKPYLEKGTDILFISFSSQLSNAINFAYTAQSQLAEEYPDCKIEIVDTLSISGGMAVLVAKALELKEEGMGLDELAEWLNTNKTNSHHWFLVDDLMFLKRGGRLSAGTAIAGTVMNIKPILTINDEGKVVPALKEKGRKKAMRKMVELVLTRAIKPEENTLIILHADCEDAANKLKEMIEKEVKFKKVFVQYIGPVIGTHTGPDTMAVCFLGDKRS